MFITDIKLKNSHVPSRLYLDWQKRYSMEMFTS